MNVGCMTLVAIVRKQREQKYDHQHPEQFGLVRNNSDVSESNNENYQDQDTISKNNYKETTQQSIIGEDEYNGSNYDYDYYTEAILRMHLEYVYSGIIFTLTNSVQKTLEDYPSWDVREALGSSVRVLRNVLDENLNLDDGQQTCLFLGGIDVFGPIPNEVCALH